MTIVCNIWMICLELNWLFYDPSWMLQLSEFVWTLRSSVWVVFNNFLLLDATDRSKIRSDQKRLFFAVSLNPLLFIANTPFKHDVFLSVPFSGPFQSKNLSSFFDICSKMVQSSNYKFGTCSSKFYSKLKLVQHMELRISSLLKVFVIKYWQV